MAVSFDDWESGIYLAHHGIKGQKWGVRRYQNENGTLTMAGKKHYGTANGGSRKLSRQYNRQTRKLARLIKGTDREYQRQLADKYKDKAAISGLLAAALGYTALTNKNGVKYALSVATPSVGKKPRAREKLVINEGKGVEIHGKGLLEEILGGKTQAQSVYYQHPGIKAINSNSALQSNSPAGGPRIKTSPSLTNTSKLLLGATAGTAGYAVYSGVRSHRANKRTTEAGHQKAIEKYKKQYGKMQKSFANTPYSDLVKKQSGSFNTIQKKEKTAIQKASNALKAYQNALGKVNQKRSNGVRINSDDLSRLNKLRENALKAMIEKNRVTGQRLY